MYADDNNVPLAAAGCFTCDIGIRHGIYNADSESTRLLAIHPVLNPPPRIDVDKVGCCGVALVAIVIRFSFVNQGSALNNRYNRRKSSMLYL